MSTSNAIHLMLNSSCFPSILMFPIFVKCYHHSPNCQTTNEVIFKSSHSPFLHSKTLIDIDEEIEKEINMKIKDYFKEHSENEFREIETKVIKERETKITNLTDGGKQIEIMKNGGKEWREE